MAEAIRRRRADRIGRSIAGGLGNPRPPVNQVPQRVYQTPNGGMVRRNDAGRVMEVRTPSGAMIHHEPNVVRRVEVVRPDGRVIVTSAGGHGYVQRQVIINNTTIVKRTYIVRDVTYGPVTQGQNGIPALPAGRGRNRRHGVCVRGATRCGRREPVGPGEARKPITPSVRF